MQQTNTKSWDKKLEILETYCKKKGYKIVKTSSEDEALDFANKVIIISDKKPAEITLYYLLHEIGHARLMTNKKKYSRTYGYMFENFCNCSLTHRVAILEEELDAWKEGVILAGKLGLKINRRRLELLKTRCISSYITWVENIKRKPKK